MLAWLKQYSKTIVAVAAGIAGVIATASVPESWKTAAAAIAATLGAILVYWTPNVPAGPNGKLLTLKQVRARG